MFAPAPEFEFAREVRTGFCGSGQKTLPCRLFYDEMGSALFEAITLLPEYGLSRADARIVRTHAPELVARLPRNPLVAELGSGSGSKTRAILEALRAHGEPLYFPIDVSGAALARCAQELSSLSVVVPLETTYLEGLSEASARRSQGQSMLTLFLGSTIGNFEPESAADFLQAARLSMKPGDALLLGTDLVKPASQLLAAYDDPTGVTAAFNRNILGRINRDLEADFDLRLFEHEARWNRRAQRVEMHLRSVVRQRINIRALGLAVDFAPGETILTEVCYKFRAPQVARMARAAGFRISAQWIDPQWPFAENLLIAV